MNYTLAQFRHFLAACSRQEAERDARLLSLMTLATRGEPRQLEKTLQQLTDYAHSHQY